MGRIVLCCFGEGCVSDHMQIATAHTELLLRIKNKPWRIPPPHKLQHFLLSATVLAVELTIEHRSVMQVGVQFPIAYMEGVQERICSHSDFICSTHTINICPIHLDSSSLFSAIHMKTLIQGWRPLQQLSGKSGCMDSYLDPLFSSWDPYMLFPSLVLQLCVRFLRTPQLRLIT